MEDDGTSHSVRSFTTVQFYSERSYDTLSVPYTSVRSSDGDNDGKNDLYKFEFRVPNVDSENVREVFAAVVFNYTLNSRINSEMKSMAAFSASTPKGASGVRAFGELVLRQKNPLYDDTYIKNEYDESPLAALMNSSATDLIYTYNQRNETTFFEHDYVIM